MVEQIDQIIEHKDKGNELFKGGDWNAAIDEYSKAIKLGGNHKELATFYKNRAAAHLKLKQYDEAIADCNASVNIMPKDPKALFRRSQAYEALERYEEAYRDAMDVWNNDTSNKAAQQILQRLHDVVQKRARENAQTSNKVKQMTDIAFDLEQSVDKRKTAISNLLVLARDSIGADLIQKNGVIERIAKLIKVEKNQEIFLNAIRIVDDVCNKSVDRTTAVLQVIGIPWFLDILNSTSEDRVNAAQHCMQTILNTYSGMVNKIDSKPIKDMCEKYSKEIDTLLTCMVYSITDRTITGMARDAIIELITRNIDYTALSWAERLVENKGLIRLMEVCSELEEYKYESAMNITASSKTIASVCLARIYENMYYDEARTKFTEQIDEFVKDKLLAPDLEAKVRVTVAITSLLLGPLDVGNAIIARDGILQMILVMATTDDILQQKVACECIVAASSKKDKAKAIINAGVDILKNLFNSKNDAVRVRALVGLCKLGSSGGLDASIRPFAEGSTMKLAEACRRFLIKPGKDKDIRKWAAEGLAYLTLDAEVKEKLIEDRPAIQALIELSKSGDQSVLYGAVTTFVNLCNAYDKQEILPEMLELAKFAKHHIPEEHELDDPDFVNKRLMILGEEGVTTALVALSKTESHNSKELIARVLNALCGLPELRGRIVQNGGAKALLPLCFEGTEKGKRQAGQALSRIGITINPEVAFPGQRNFEVIRPLLNQLHPDCSALENFEALMALCNMAQLNETVRQRILKEGGLSKCELYLMEDHLLLCRAACQVICNLVLSDDVVKQHELPNDRVKFLCLLCMEEDEETAKAASGALAILTGSSKKCCEKILDPEQWLDVLHTLIANPCPDVQHRGMVIILNMINSDIEIAQRLFDTDVMQLIVGLAQLPDDTRHKARQVAQECLDAAEKYRVIQKQKEMEEEDMPMPDPHDHPSATIEEITE